MKKAFFAVAVAVVLAASVQAGEIKFHQWPTVPVPQEIAVIPVVVDIGFWIRIKNQPGLRIVLSQISIQDYQGCVNVTVETNTNVTFSCSIARVLDPGTGQPVLPGDYSCSVDPANIDRPGGTMQVCARVRNPNLGAIPGGTRGVHVANVTLRVVPRV
jgi:hypothetical protein